jgi:heme A synthase
MHGSNALLRLSSWWLFLLACQITLGAWTIWSNKAADIATAHVAVGAITFGVGITLAAICLRTACEQKVTHAAPISEVATSL